MDSPAARWTEELLPTLILFLIAAPLASMAGREAGTLQLPTAWFAQTSHFWMLAFIVASLAIPAPRLSKTVWFLGLACVAYAPVLLALGSTSIPLSRSLSREETTAFRQQFPVPIVLYSASGEGDRLRVRRQDLTDAMRTHLQTINVLRDPDKNH